jgi:dienelactone hydrolase
MTLRTFADGACAAGGRETVRIDVAPDGSARARVTSPALLGIADHRHAVRWWRDLRIDESAGGLAAQRAQPTAVAIEHGGRSWPLPVHGLLGCDLAWSPLAPLVAGLAVSGGRAHPWVADYARRTVRSFEHVRAATSLTALDRPGGSPLCWLDGHRLAFLAARPPRDAGPAPDEPLVFEAAGPGFVSFEPGLGDLIATAGAAISLLHVGDEAVQTLTPALLVRRLQRHAGGRPGVLVRHATGVRDGGGGGRSLVWSAARLDVDAVPATLRPLQDRALVEPPAPPPRPVLTGEPDQQPPPRPVLAGEPDHQPPRPGPAGEPASTPAGAGPRLSSSTLMLAVGGAAHPARLAVFPESAGNRPAATLLWVRACRGPLDDRRPVPAPVPDGGTPTAILDLPLHWPADASLGLLHEQIVTAVQAAVAALREDAADRDRRLPVVVGGHSFGATLALYALAHARGLAGAIVHSGCYNRTHTPFGFQYERRRLWDAPDVYTAFSALCFADRIAGPVLIVHGLEDVNPATHPDQAADLYRAIVATSGTARLVLLPREEHTFRYRETHARLARVHREWLERIAAAGGDAAGAAGARASAADAGAPRSAAQRQRAVTADGR